jgi:hypothetical protein
MSHKNSLFIITFILVNVYTYCINAAQISSVPSSASDVATDIHVECNRDEMLVSFKTPTGRFNGMVYPRGLSKNSSCLVEWVQRKTPVKYKLPLRGCNTMSTQLDNGGIEYFNTIVIQPHLKLVTNQGKGFHIRCKYNTRAALEKNYITEEKQVTAVAETMPGCVMKIYSGDSETKLVAENVKIGDPLTLQVSLDSQDIYGIWVTDCLVRDGLGWGEQKLINDEGCPVDSEIMGMFVYSEDKTTAVVEFKAHKFPYTASVYYQCNVKLCLKAEGNCKQFMPPNCGNRLRRQTASETDSSLASSINSSEGTPATIEVYSGLYVNEANDLAKTDADQDSVFSEKSEDSLCISQRSFAIGICIAGLILMLCVILAILCLLSRRRNKKTTSNPSSSIYSGPYTNTAYSHSS